MADVIVVGGGPAGAASALRLARAGLDVTLLERGRYPREKPCGEYMSPGVVAELHRLGIGAAVERAAGARLEGFTVFAPGATFTGRFAPAMERRASGVGQPPPPAPLPRGRGGVPKCGSDAKIRHPLSQHWERGPGSERRRREGASPTSPPYGLGIARATMDHILIQAAADVGVDVREGVRVVDVIRDGGLVAGVRALHAGRTEEVRAPLVIGADGVRSVVARRLGALELRQGMRRVALVAHVAGIDRLDVMGEMHVGRGGYCGVAPLGGGTANVAMVLRDAAPLRGRPEAFFWEYLDTLPGLAVRLRDARIIQPVLATGPLSFRARFFSTDGALLAGDAGGYYDPFTGQGVHRALLTAEIAAEVAVDALAAGDVSAARLRAYDRRRRALSRGPFMVEWLVQQFIGRPALFARAAHRLAARPAMADTLVSVTGDLLPPRHVLSPWYLGRLL